MSTTRRRRPPVADHDANIAGDSTSTSTNRRSSPIRGAASDTRDQSRRHDSTRRGDVDAAGVVILVALVLLIILLQKFGFCGPLWVVLFGFFRLLWVALLSFGRAIWPLLWVAVPALIMILSIAMGVEWVRERSGVARPPTTTGRGGEGNDSRISTEESANRGGPRKFTYKELEEATSSFYLKLGQGASGTVYKGHIGKDQEPVAVKIITSAANRRISEFIAEVITMIQLSHTNLVKLKGYCHDLNELVNPPVCKFALVYEFIGGGTLYDHLFKPKYLLTWENRYNIALGLASALHYLRKKRPLCVIHRDIKSSNIMLDEALVAKLGDFGTAKLVDHTEEPSTIQQVGTPGYWAPEYIGMGVLSRESDIYSFGVVLLEIVCGRKAVFSRGQGRAPQNLVEWVWKRYGRGKLLDAVDSRLKGNFDKEQAEALTMAGLWCVHPDPSRRPSIEKAKTYLDLKEVPPKLPSKKPRFGY